MIHGVLSFSEITNAQMIFAGGKGETLARLYQAGYPVPDGFIIFPFAFAGDDLPPEMWKHVRDKLDRVLKSANGRVALAVRSSALSEDSSQASFAGEFESVLSVRNEDEIRSAIRTVRRSRLGERVQAYSKVKGVEIEHEMAVVVQRFIPAEISGVLFSADPITGDQTSMLGNFTLGSGEKLVSGEVSGETFTLSHPEGQYNGPPELKRHARQLYRLANRLEKELGCPQDIEWGIVAGKLFLLQSRPITALQGYNPATGEWNDSLRGNFLWSNVNYGEAVPDVMTPLTWSLMRQGALGDWIDFQGYLSFGNICGRMYFNISVLASIFHLLGKSDEQLLDLIEATLHTSLPGGTTIPVIPAPKRALSSIIPKLLKIQWQERQGVKRLPKLIAANLVWCNRMKHWVQDSLVREELVFLWNTEIGAQTKKLWLGVLHSANQYVSYTTALRQELSQLVGPDDADALISGGSSQEGLLASLGPVVGIDRLARGEMSRQAFLENYGHRGEEEFELSKPRLVENPAWIDRQMEKCDESGIDVDALLVKQHTEFEAAWQRFRQQYPHKVNAMRKRIDQVSRRSHLREAARSELARVLWVIRQWVLRAGEITSIGEDIYFLTLDELLVYLAGDERAKKLIPARKETYYRYKSLPAYPAVIRGRFDPFKWAANPNRRTDIFDEHSAACSGEIAPSHSDKILGAAGSAGRTEGIVRVLCSPEEGDQFRPGEVLVTAQTNIGWTVIFPRAAAIVTDVGAPLSHAAVVARELGIPAVVGCGDATMRLQTGDRVLVDGGQGTVEILEKVKRDPEYQERQSISQAHPA